MEEKDFRNIIMMIQNKLDNLFICINDKQVVLDIDAAKLFGVGIDTVNKAINNNGSSQILVQSPIFYMKEQYF